MTRRLLLAALIALIVCTGFGFKVSCTAPATAWCLTVKSTEGGSVITPGEGMFWCYDGQALVLNARPDPGYRFVSWTGRVGAINDVCQSTTIITMELDYTITANFTPMGEVG